MFIMMAVKLTKLLKYSKILLRSHLGYTLMAKTISRQVLQPTSIAALAVFVGIFMILPLAYAQGIPSKAVAEVRDSNTGVPQPGARCVFTFYPSHTFVGPVIADSNGNAGASPTDSNDTWFDVTCANVPGPGMGTQSGIGLEPNGTSIIVLT